MLATSLSRPFADVRHGKQSAALRQRIQPPSPPALGRTDTAVVLITRRLGIDLNDDGHAGALHQRVQIEIPDNGTYNNHRVVLGSANPRERDRAERERCWVYSDGVNRRPGDQKILSVFLDGTVYPRAIFAHGNWLSATLEVDMDLP